MSSTKKTTTKKTVAKVAPTHPKFIEMIKQCIIDTKEDSRVGVSRPQIKQYLASHYKLDMSSKANIGHLARGIAQGAQDEVFVLPKGISGRVKLYKAPAADKENVKPTSASKSATVKTPAAKAPVKKAAPAPVPKKKAAAPAAKKAVPAPAPKKKAAAPVAKKAAPVKKAAAPKKAAPVAKKTATKTKSSTSRAATATKAKAAPKKVSS
ncbi:hypothetical protein BDY24DRAFT_398925 [Mrakia frigida]|uniref:histone H1 n=1 Tax=Mrakia frigida TaxID=29902 RepID=UPI003FCC1D5C